jgi:hypothetical protein
MQFVARTTARRALMRRSACLTTPRHIAASSLPSSSFSSWSGAQLTTTSSSTSSSTLTNRRRRHYSVASVAARFASLSNQLEWEGQAKYYAILSRNPRAVPASIERPPYLRGIAASTVDDGGIQLKVCYCVSINEFNVDCCGAFSCSSV